MRKYLVCLTDYKTSDIDNTRVIDEFESKDNAELCIHNIINELQEKLQGESKHYEFLKNESESCKLGEGMFVVVPPSEPYNFTVYNKVLYKKGWTSNSYKTDKLCNILLVAKLPIEESNIATNYSVNVSNEELLNSRIIAMNVAADVFRSQMFNVTEEICKIAKGETTSPIKSINFMKCVFSEKYIEKGKSNENLKD